MKKKKVVICVSLKDEKQTKELEHLKGSGLLENCHVQLVSIFKIGRYMNELSFYDYPSSDQYDTIKSSVSEILESIGRNIAPESAKVESVCLFDANPKLKMRNYLEQEKIDLVISSIRQHGVEGIFTSSFTDYLCRSAPCDVYVVKSRADK